MDFLLDGDTAPKYRALPETQMLRMPAVKKRQPVSRESIDSAHIAHERMVAIRNEHIAIAAYLKAEARGFALGHETDDWLTAQAEIDAKDAGMFFR